MSTTETIAAAPLDPGQLERQISALFAVLPGGVPAPWLAEAAAQTGAPAVPAAPGSALAPQAGLTPHAAGPAAGQGVSLAPPIAQGGVPSAGPSLGSAPGAAGFPAPGLSSARLAQPVQPLPPALDVQGPRGVTALGGGLPDLALSPLPVPPEETALQALLAGLPAARSPVPASPFAPATGGPATGTTPQFYFLPTTGTPAGTVPQNLPAQPPSSPSSLSSATPAYPGSGGGALDVSAIRRDFPILEERVNGRKLIWLDNAATTQKPRVVIERLSYFYQHENSNIHRAAHELAARATDAYEAARDSVSRFLNARSAEEIVFVRGTTEAINLVAKSWGAAHLGKGDEILITWLEHHANIVPWQQLCQQTGAVLKVAPVDDSGQIILEEYQKLLGSKTKLVSLTQVSNALGTVTPARQMVALAHQAGAKVLVDGAQSVSHMPTDVQALGCDWFVFSGHKVFGPTGIGALYGKADVLADMPAWQGGGNMIKDVTFEKTVYHPAPALFEAGTGNIADAVGLKAALDYVMAIGMEAIARHEHDLLVYGTRLLLSVPGLRLIGTAAEKAGVLSFVLPGRRTEDIGAALNRDGIAVRSGHHCAQPILRRFGVEASVRPSLALYNTRAELDALAASLHRLVASA